MAANLGAKLTGPLLLKSFEKLFDGSIKVIQDSFALTQSPITWLDIVTFARSTPSEFALSDSGHGVKTCRLWIREGLVEISEEDYRLIRSGAPDRVIPNQPIAEDESAELGTLNILEARLVMLIKKADAVASRARQLNYHLKGRKTAILARKAADQPTSAEESHTFSPQPFSAINARAPNPITTEAAKLQQDLLEQFSSESRRNSVHPPRPKASRVSTDFSYPFNGDDNRRMSHPLTASEDGIESQYRVLMAARIEKLARGDVINPPCDRCRRLKFECTKHLTACSACTKKHAKCSWKDVKEGELDAAPAMSLQSSTQGENGGADGSGVVLPAHGSSEDFGLATQKTRERLAKEQERREKARAYADPGFGVSGSGNFASGEEQRLVQSLSEQSAGEQMADLSSEHAILTQIASAAAAAGR